MSPNYEFLNLQPSKKPTHVPLTNRSYCYCSLVRVQQLLCTPHIEVKLHQNIKK